MGEPPIRITIALGKPQADLLKRLRDEGNMSISEIVRKAVKFYSEYRNVLSGDIDRKVRTYLDMLPKGEHVIVDIEHWILLMKMVEALPTSDGFWNQCERIAKDHAEEFKGKFASAQVVLQRLEDCNFFRLQKNSEKEFTLVLNSENARRFVEHITRHLLSAMGYHADFKPSSGKIRVNLRE